MSTYRSNRSYVASWARMEREAARRQRELERQRKEQQKQDQLAQARLEVAESENQLEILLSLHKDCAPPVDWQILACTLQPPEPVIVAEEARRTWRLQCISSPLGGWSDEPAVYLKQPDHPEHIAFTTDLRAWEKNKRLAERILAGSEDAWTEALSAFAYLDEVAQFGTEIDITVHPGRRVECIVSCKDISVIPLTTKTLTSTGKLSEKNTPWAQRQEFYQDYICSNLLRVVREIFAVLPTDLLLIHGHASVHDSATGTDNMRPIYSVSIARSKLPALDFDRLDPSDAIESFPHRGDFKSSRKLGAFQAIEPLRFDDNTVNHGAHISLEALHCQATALRVKLTETFGTYLQEKPSA